MIAGVRGTVTARSGDLVTIATAGGVSYEMAVPISVLEQLPPAGGDVDLHTVLVVREDGWALFGFETIVPISLRRVVWASCEIAKMKFPMP